MTEKKFIKNTAILFVSMAITKIVGALFKIPLANLLGGTGLGYFSSAYGLYSPIFAVTAAGIPTVIMRTTARCSASGNLCRAAAVRKCALMMFSAIGLFGTLCVAVFAKPFSEYIACSPQSLAGVLCISPAVMLCCISSVFRGYREGLSDVVPSSASAISEAVSRAIFGLGLSFAVIFYAKSRFSNGLDVFGTACSTEEQAYSAALPYAAAGAVLAVSLSELAGLITLIIIERKRKNRVVTPKRCEYSRREICLSLLKEITPIAASALVVNCVSFVDLLTVTRTLSQSAVNNPAFFSENFGDILNSCGGIEGLPNFMYGSYTGIAMTLFMIIPSFAGMASTAAAPDIAAAWEVKDTDRLIGKIRLQLRAGAMIACPACLGAAALASPILNMLYKSRAAEVSVCLDSFVILCLGGIFMTASSALFGIFQSIGKAKIPLILMSASIALKFLLNPLLISIPQLNIAGAALSSVIGYVIMAIGGTICLKIVLPEKINIFGAFFTPFICACGCAAAAFFVHRALETLINPTLNVIISTLLGGVVYAILLILTGCFRTSGIINKKNIKKCKKTLAK